MVTRIDNANGLVANEIGRNDPIDTAIDDIQAFVNRIDSQTLGVLEIGDLRKSKLKAKLCLIVFVSFELRE